MRENTKLTIFVLSAIVVISAVSYTTYRYFFSAGKTAPLVDSVLQSGAKIKDSEKDGVDQEIELDNAKNPVSALLSAVKLDDQITLLKVTEVDPVTQKEMDEQAMKVGLKPVDHIDVVYHEHSFDLISHDEGYTFILTVGVKEDSPVEATDITNEHFLENLDTLGVTIELDHDVPSIFFLSSIDNPQTRVMLSHLIGDNLNIKAKVGLFLDDTSKRFKFVLKPSYLKLNGGDVFSYETGLKGENFMELYDIKPVNELLGMTEAQIKQYIAKQQKKFSPGFGSSADVQISSKTLDDFVRLTLKGLNPELASLPDVHFVYESQQSVDIPNLDTLKKDGNVSGEGTASLSAMNTVDGSVEFKVGVDIGAALKSFVGEAHGQGKVEIGTQLLKALLTNANKAMADSKALEGFVSEILTDASDDDKQLALANLHKMLDNLNASDEFTHSQSFVISGDVLTKSLRELIQKHLGEQPLARYFEPAMLEKADFGVQYIGGNDQRTLLGVKESIGFPGAEDTVTVNVDVVSNRFENLSRALVYVASIIDQSFAKEGAVLNLESIAKAITQDTNISASVSLSPKDFASGGPAKALSSLKLKGSATSPLVNATFSNDGHTMMNQYDENVSAQVNDALSKLYGAGQSIVEVPFPVSVTYDVANQEGVLTMGGGNKLTKICDDSDGTVKGYISALYDAVVSKQFLPAYLKAVYASLPVQDGGPSLSSNQGFSAIVMMGGKCLSGDVFSLDKLCSADDFNAAIKTCLTPNETEGSVS